MKVGIPTLSAVIIAACVLIILILGLYYSAISWRKAFDDGTPGVIDISELPYPLKVSVEEMDEAGVDTEQIDAYRVYGEYDMDQTTVCRLPYSSDVVGVLIEILDLKPVNDPSVSDCIARITDGLPDEWRITSDLDPKLLTNNLCVDGEEGAQFCLIFNEESTLMYLYYKFNF